MTVVDYDELVAQYAERLQTVLRGFSIGPRFLEAWVPDEDPVRGVRGVLSAARVAGLSALTVRLGAETARACDDWAAALAGWGRVELTHSGGALRMEVHFGTECPALPERERRSARVVPVQARAVAPAPALAASLRERVLAAAREASHVGSLVGGSVIGAQRDGVTLTLDVDDQQVVRRARFEGDSSPELCGLLELLCRVAEGLPLQELAEHGALRVLALARDADAAPPVPGVVQPQNTSTLLAFVEALVRDACRGRGSGENRWQPPASSDWLALDDAARRTRVEAALADACAVLGVPADTFELQRIRDGHKVCLDVAPAVPAAERRRLLLALERELAARVEGTLIVEREARADLNRIRRL